MSPLFQPIRLGNLELANRIVVSPMCQYSADDGCANEWHLTHLGMLANSGAGLVVVESTGVERHGRITHGCMGLYSDRNEAALNRLVDHCHRIGTAKIAVQLGHAGRKGSSQRPWEGGGALPPNDDPWTTFAPSALPFGPDWHVPKEITLDEMARVRDSFVSAAQRAVRIGFDAIELHFAHGYLLHEFFSPVSNTRRDEYGGSLENRMRYLREVARAVRAVVPRGTPVAARVTASDWLEGGIAVDDTVALASALKSDGLDYLCVSSGGLTAQARNPAKPGYNTDLSARIRQEAGIPCRVVGLIVDPHQAEAIIGEGRADMVALARAMLDDPHWGWRAASVLGGEVARPVQYQRAGPKLWPGKAVLSKR
jgi:NADPH2 dehydrogenase